MPGAPGSYVCVSYEASMLYQPPCPDVITPGAQPLKPCSQFAHVKSVIEPLSYSFAGEFGRWSVW